jgi:hypothetical protein
MFPAFALPPCITTSCSEDLPKFYSPSIAGQYSALHFTNLATSFVCRSALSSSPQWTWTKATLSLHKRSHPYDPYPMMDSRVVSVDDGKQNATTPRQSVMYVSDTKGIVCTTSIAERL